MFFYAQEPCLWNHEIDTSFCQSLFNTRLVVGSLCSFLRGRGIILFILSSMFLFVFFHFFFNWVLFLFFCFFFVSFFFCLVKSQWGFFNTWINMHPSFNHKNILEFSQVILRTNSIVSEDKNLVQWFNNNTCIFTSIRIFSSIS